VSCSIEFFPPFSIRLSARKSPIVRRYYDSVFDPSFFPPPSLTSLFFHDSQRPEFMTLAPLYRSSIFFLHPDEEFRTAQSPPAALLSLFPLKLPPSPRLTSPKKICLFFPILYSNDTLPPPSFCRLLRDFQSFF